MTLVQQELSHFLPSGWTLLARRCGAERLTLRILMFDLDLILTIPGYRFSKSTGSFTSCTRKYFASAGYFFATASYIAYATLR